MHVAVYVLSAVGGFVIAGSLQVYPVLVAVGIVIVPPDHWACNVASPAFTHCLFAFVYPDTLAISLPSVPITFVPPDSAVHHPVNVHVLVALVVDKVAAGVPGLNVIVYILFGFVIAELKLAESYVAFTLVVPVAVAREFFNVIVYLFAVQCAYNV